MTNNEFNNWIDIHEKLPIDGQRCIIWDERSHVSYNGNPETIVHVYAAWFIQGEHRPNGPWRSCDTGFSNNKYPWCWKDGAMTWESQYVTHWMPIPHTPFSKEKS